MSSSIVGGELVANVTQIEVMGKTLQVLQGDAFICFDSPYEEPQNFSAFAQKVMKEKDITDAWVKNSGRLSFIYDPTGATAGFCVNKWQTFNDRDDWGVPKWWTATMNSLMTVGINATYNSETVGWNSTSKVMLSDRSLDWLFSQNYVYNATTNDQVWQELSPAKIVENLVSALTKLLRNPGFNKLGNEFVYREQPSSVNLSYYEITYTGADTVPGNVGNIVPYVKIRWPWLVVPYVLSVGGIVFLLYTMYVSRQSRAPL